MSVHSEFLSIGEFSNATQLSAKALRLYDDARVLLPAYVDATTGYRYYRREQIAVARLIRRLREMDIPVAAIPSIVGASAAQANAMLLEFAKEVDRRYVAQKRAFQAGLALLHRQPRKEAPAIDHEWRPAIEVVIKETMVTRATLMRRLHLEVDSLRACVDKPVGEPFCWLSEPISDEASRVTVALPIDAAASVAPSLQTRMLSATQCAVHRLAQRTVELPDVEAALDAIFDWLDRNAGRTLEPPSIRISLNEDAPHAVAWAYEPAKPQG